MGVTGNLAIRNTSKVGRRDKRQTQPVNIGSRRQQALAYVELHPGVNLLVAAAILSAGADDRRYRETFYSLVGQGDLNCDRERRLWIIPQVDPDAARAERRCLSCGDGFDSEWAGNRICGKCRTHVDHAMPIHSLGGNRVARGRGAP